MSLLAWTTGGAPNPPQGVASGVPSVDFWRSGLPHCPICAGRRVLSRRLPSRLKLRPVGLMPLGVCDTCDGKGMVLPFPLCRGMVELLHEWWVKNGPEPA